jgi:hypothetical protein
MVNCLSSLSYEDWLRKLKLPTLAYRRSHSDMVELYKILSGKYDEDVSNLLQTRDESTTRGHQYKLYKSHSRLDIRKYSCPVVSGRVYHNFMVVDVFFGWFFQNLFSRDSNDMMVGAVTTLDGKLFHISTVLWSYEDRLRKLKLPTLAYRRSRDDMI